MNDLNEKMHPALNISEPPLINVLSEDKFKERVSIIFEMVADKLSRSYGPHGSSAVIGQYPYSDVTKDGFSIARRLSFSKEYNIIDDSIKNLILAPCSRLNYAVGDGTTTAIVSVNAIYQEFIRNKEKIDKLHIPPRDILKAYNRVRDRIIDSLDNEIERVDTMSHDDMVKIISMVAYISSNADEMITGLIHDLYDELDYPLIDIKKAPDGITKKSVIKGYHFNAILRDNVYVNNDDFTAEHTNVDVILFDHKVTSATFSKILEPLNEACRKLGRHLVVIAPVYDDVAMLTVSRTLMGEYKAIKDVNMILMVGSMTRGIERNMYEDLAMLLNTTIINMGLERDIIEKVDSGVPLESIIDMNQRGIENVLISIKDGERTGITTDNGHVSEKYNLYKLIDDSIRLGFAGKVVLGTKDGSTFDDLHYDKDVYQKTIDSVKHYMEEAQKKSEAISTYNFEAKDLQNRLFKLQMRIGTIEVGGESMLSQGLLEAAVDDTVKAAASAYHNGIVKGCSVSTLRAIKETMQTIEFSPIETLLIEFIYNGFRSVYKVLLSSYYDDFDINLNQLSDVKHTAMEQIYSLFVDKWGWKPETFDEIWNYEDLIIWWKLGGDTLSAYDFVIDMSIILNRPFDLSSHCFNLDIVNSAKTDKEILLASSDLISLLIVGNQFIVADN